MKAAILFSLIPLFSAPGLGYAAAEKQPFPENYVNKDGFVTVKPDANPIPGEGNGWLQTGLAVATGMIPANPAMLAASRKSDSIPLVWRSPYKVNPGDETQADDYWGALVISEDWAKEINTYASAHNWNFDIGGKSRFDYWFGRFPGFAAFVRLCANVPPLAQDDSQLTVTITWATSHLDDASANMKTFLLISKARARGGEPKKAADLWIERIRAKYGTIGASWAAYFGPGHPLNNYDGENLAD